MSRHSFCLLACLMFAMTFRVDVASSAETRPNFVIILADDLGYADVGYHGGQARTPHIDRLASTGVKLDHHYVFPMCSPTRAALLSGRYASRFGCVAATNDQVFPFGTPTLPALLKDAGYATAICGKWHLGSMLEAYPGKFGFGESYGSMSGGVGPLTHVYKPGPYLQTWHRNGQYIDEQGHVTDLFTREAVRFIERSGAQPFFLYVPFTAVHVPISEEPKWLEANAHIADEGARLYAATTTHLDDSVGQIVAALEKKNLRERTLVLFLSDNGAHDQSRNDRNGGYAGDYPAVEVGGSNTPWRGFKTQLYEGGICTAAIAHWPGKLSPRAITSPLHITDWLPTLLGLAGVQRLPAKLDGQDIWPVVSGAQSAKPRTFYWLGVGRRMQALRHGDWKLLVPQSGDVELYNLANDPGETKNLASEREDLVKQLTELMKTASAADNDSVAPQPGKKSAGGQ